MITIEKPLDWEKTLIQRRYINFLYFFILDGDNEIEKLFYKKNN